MRTSFVSLATGATGSPLTPNDLAECVVAGRWVAPPHRNRDKTLTSREPRQARPPMPSLSSGRLTNWAWTENASPRGRMGLIERIGSDLAYLTGVLGAVSKVTRVAKSPNRTFPQVARELAATHGDKPALISEAGS